MIYKFKSKAAGDLIMLGPNGDALMRTLGRQPASQGIIEVADMAAAISAIRAAGAADEALQAQAQADAAARGQALPARQGVAPRQRIWPMLEMLGRAQAAQEPIVWGV